MVPFGRNALPEEASESGEPTAGQAGIRCETFVHGIDGIERMRLIRDGIVARVRRLHHHLI